MDDKNCCPTKDKVQSTTLCKDGDEAPHIYEQEKIGNKDCCPIKNDRNVVGVNLISTFKKEKKGPKKPLKDKCFIVDKAKRGKSGMWKSQKNLTKKEMANNSI